MILYFADRQLNILGMASTKLKKGMEIVSDLKVEDVESGVASFEATFSYSRENRRKVEECTRSGNYILRKSGKENEFYTITESESDTGSQEVSVYAEDAGLDLLNEVVGNYEADKAYPIEYYINKFAYDSGFVVGRNEVPHLSRKLKWEGEATVTERLASVAKQFDHAEISYSFEIERLKVTRKLINIHKKRGIETDVQLRKGKEVEKIVVKQSITELATALLVTGGAPEDSDVPITLKGYKYDDGDFYVDGDKICSRKALEKWSRYVWKDEPHQILGNVGHIVKTYSYDTLSQSELCKRSVTKLKSICDVDINYEADIVELPENVQIGDRVTIIDDDIGLYLNTRLLKLETSDTEKTKTATFGEYILKNSGISREVELLAEKFKELSANKTFYTWIAYADDESGSGISLFPDGKIYMGIAENKISDAVDLSDPKVFKWSKIKGDKGEQGDQGAAGADGENGKTSYLHIAYANSADGSVDFSVFDSINKQYIGQYTDFYINDSLNYRDYKWTKIKGEKGDRGEQGLQGLQGERGEQGIPGTNGLNGTSSYFHIKYSPVLNPSQNQMTETPSKYIGTYVDSNPNDSQYPNDYKWTQFQGSQGEKGEQGIAGINGEDGRTSYLHIAYANSADGSVGFSVSDSINKQYIGQYTDFYTNDSYDYRDYKWTKIKGDKGDKGEQGIAGENGNSGIIISPTAPLDPEVGQLWQVANGEPIKSWNGSSWELYYVSVKNLNVQTLSAITSNLGKVNSADINNFLNGVKVLEIKENLMTFFDKYESRVIGGVGPIQEVRDEYGVELWSTLFSQLVSGATFLRVRPNGMNLHATNITINEKNDLTKYANMNVLWSGELIMNASEQAVLTESILSQPHGIILVFSAYDTASGQVGDWWWNTQFIPKKFVEQHPWVKYCFNLSGGADAVGFGRKMLGFYDTKVIGDNANQGAYTAGGVRYENNRFVLRCVYGV